MRTITRDYLTSRITTHMDVFKRLALDTHIQNVIMDVCNTLCDVIANRGKLFLCGNGGSAADAQHIAAEFVGRFYKERPGMNAEALTVNSSILTCIGNDYSFDTIFLRQLEAKASPGDMLIGLSTSGKSNNVTKALSYAKNNQICSVLIMGDFDNSNLVNITDYIIKAPSNDTPRIQEAHIFIGHLLAEYVEDNLA